MIKRLNKKGQDLSIGTLILIVLGIVVLVLLILGFSLGWSNLWDRINIFGGGASLNDVVTACNLAVTSQNSYAFCQDFRKIKTSAGTEYVNCQDGRVSPSLNGQITCTGNPSQDYCTSLVNAGTATETKRVKVNNANCPDSTGVLA